MSAKITTRFGEAVPPAPRHSVTVHMPGWINVERYGDDSSSVIATFKNAYPRMKPHRDISTLSEAVLANIGGFQKACLIFSSLQSARECVEYSTSRRRENGQDKHPVPYDEMEIIPFNAKDLFYAVVYSVNNRSVVASFWSSPGAGISSRFAEANLGYLDQLTRLPIATIKADRSSFDGPIHQKIRERIVYYLERAPLNPHAGSTPSTDDIFLYQTGMASIYKPHTYMLQYYKGTTILFGMAFMNTLSTFEEFGARYKLFGLGTDDDMECLEVYLRNERSQGRKVQAIWTEFPGNPNLVTPDLKKLRQLADEYDSILAVDDTIGSWANIDITNVADMLATSLTKTFNGNADVIAGSIILNPASRKYKELRLLFDTHYVPELYRDDAEAIERNSRDYLSRTMTHNKNAKSLAEYLEYCAKDPKSAVRQVYYPSINPSGKHYTSFMRPATSEFSPGYGCLLSVEFSDISATSAFYDDLNVHKGPHLGAPFTLAFAYTMCTYKSRLDWAEAYGLRPTQIRIAAGREDINTLLEEFKMAVAAANRAKKEKHVETEG